MAFSEELENIEDLSENIKVKKFENTSSSKLELQTLLWALSEVSERKIISYTDSQTIVGLLARKQRLQESAYCSKAGRQIRNHELYREFFEYTDKFDIQFHHIRGHKSLMFRTPLDSFFAFVDKASRKALRIYSKIHSNGLGKVTLLTCTSALATNLTFWSWTPYHVFPFFCSLKIFHLILTFENPCLSDCFSSS